MTRNTAVAKRRYLSIVIVGAAVAAVTIAAAVFLGSGIRLFMVQTPSMGTAAPVGTLLVVDPHVDYGVGDLVSFTVDGRVISHRIVDESDGTITTQGDLNGSPDGWELTSSDIIGKAVWIAPGLGWLLKALPWLLLGAALTEVIARLKLVKRSWRWGIRLSGWAVAVTIVAIWLRPWFNIELLGFRPADTGGGVLMHVVNTGLLPLRAGVDRIVSGQDTVVHVTDQLSSGGYAMTPTPAIGWGWQVAIIAFCLLPLIASLFIRQGDDPASLAAAEPATAKAEARSHNALIAVIAAVAVIIVIVLNLVTFSGAAFAASVQNTADRAGTNSFFTCRAAETSLGAANTFAAFALGTAGTTTEPDISGNGRTATLMASGTVNTSIGCKRDTPVSSLNFNGTTQCAYVNTAVNNPNTFTLEAWFRTPNVSNGKIIGFGSTANSVAEATYDRHVYIDSAGRVVFGVYSSLTVQTVSSPAGVSYADNAWHHVVATLSSGGMQLYVDGNLVDSKPAITSGQSYIGYWKIGCGKLDGWQNGSGTAYSGPARFTGQIQYAAVYTAVLSSTQVKEHYLAGR